MATASSNRACGLPNRLLIRNASNASFSQTMSVISIPSSGAEIDEVVQGLWESYFTTVQSDAELEFVLKMGPVKQQLAAYSADEIKDSVKRIRDSSDDLRPVKEVEFEAFSKSKIEQSNDRPGGDFFARELLSIVHQSSNRICSPSQSIAAKALLRLIWNTRKLAERRKMATRHTSRHSLNLTQNESLR